MVSAALKCTCICLWSKSEGQFFLGSAALRDTICHLISSTRKKQLILITLKDTHTHTHIHTDLVCRLCRLDWVAPYNDRLSSHGGFWQGCRGLPLEGDLWRSPLSTQTQKVFHVLLTSLSVMRQWSISGLHAQTLLLLRSDESCNQMMSNTYVTADYHILYFVLLSNLQWCSSYWEKPCFGDFGYKWPV